MAQAAQKMDEEQVPGGGIADFIMSDEEIAALEAEETKEEFGDSGIANFQEVASRMASYGRFGDDSLAHVETGELIVPKALIDQSPELKESIFNHLKELGVEDPERYVVGTDRNSINPETGLPEFFLKKIFRGAKKLVSGVAKGVKKAFKSVGKVLKKVAPVVLPIALAMTPLGPIYGAALGSGIGTLVQGGSIKDALKSALISGASGAVFTGVSSKLGGGTFVGGVKDAAANPLGRLGQTGSAISSGDPFQSFSTPVDPGDIPAEIRADQSRMDTLMGKSGTTPADVQQAAMQPQNNLADVELYSGSYGQNIPPQPNVTGGNFAEAELYNQAYGGTPTQTTGGITQTGQGVTTGSQTATDSSFFDRMKGYASDAKDFAGDVYSDYLSPSRNQLTNSEMVQGANKLVQESGGQLSFDKAMELTAAQSGGSFIQNYAPLAAAGVGAAYLGGAFEPAPVEDPNLVQRNADGSVTTGSDLIAADPNEYLVAGGDPRYSSGQYVVGTRYGLPSGGQTYRNPFMRPQMYAADGGEVYPRRNGGIMPNEGVPDQDSVRALLMPGEFVMTKDAVRGLGNGNLNQGINNMYSMMRNLEAKGQRA